MKILLLGKYGQLGWELRRTLAPLGPVWAHDYPDPDLTKPEAVRLMIGRLQPDLIVNATAYTAVDKAEAEPELAMAINGFAPGVLAEEAQRLGAALIHYSTDYVFDGHKDEAYLEEDPTNPLNMYGKSKLAGERAVQTVEGAYLIFRTSWVYSLRGSSFVTKVLSWARANETLKIVADQISNPTWARMLAEITAQVIVSAGPDLPGWMRPRRGIYHLAGSGYASRFEWGQAILKYDPQRDEQVARKLERASSSEFPTPAERPLFSALNCDHFERTFGIQLPDWETSLRLAMDFDF